MPFKRKRSGKETFILNLIACAVFTALYHFFGWIFDKN